MMQTKVTENVFFFSAFPRLIEKVIAVLAFIAVV